MQSKFIKLLIAVILLLVGTLAFKRHRSFVSNPQIIGKNSGELEILSKTYRLDEIYLSMKGPRSLHRSLRLVDGDKDELLWITGITTEVTARNGETKMSPEFLCHANFTLDRKKITPENHNALFDNSTHLQQRILTLVPGDLEIQFPDGFGVPIFSSEQFDLFTMALNANLENPDIDIRFRTKINFLRDSETTITQKALFRRELFGMVKVDTTETSEYIPLPGHDSLDPTESCAEPLRRHLGQVASNAGVLKKKFGTEHTVHWLVPPGQYLYQTEVTKQLELPFDTTIHYATAHLHPHAESVELRDLTTNTSLMKFTPEEFKDKIGIATMGHFSSQSGVEINRDHRYELITNYNNKTSEPIDAMSIVFLYLSEQNFKKPQAH